jgi:hypothetical protein
LAGGLTKGGVFYVHETLALPPWGWAVVVTVVASPLLGFLVHVWRDDETIAGAQQTVDQI